MTSEYDADTVSAPRLVVMNRSPGGYGFNLHGERNQKAGQTISAVDDGSEAQKAGLRVGDKVIEVNGVNVEQFNHSEVVNRIKKNPQQVSMLVIDHITEAYLRQEGRPITADMANLMTVYQPKQAPSEPEATPPAVAVEDAAPEVQEASVEETAPTPTVVDELESSEQHTTIVTTNNTENEEEASREAEVANDATTPEEVKQLNEVLDKEDAGESTPEPAPVHNGTESHPPVQPAPEPTPEPTPQPVFAPAPAPAPTQVKQAQAPMQKPSGAPKRRTVKEDKTSFADKYKAFTAL